MVQRAREIRAATTAISETAAAGPSIIQYNRRRRRSPSTDEEEIRLSAEPATPGIEERQNLRAFGGNRNLPPPGAAPKAPSPKRRRLMNKAAMRLDPDSSSSNGPQYHANGSSPETQKSRVSASTNGHSSPTNGTVSPTHNGLSKSSSKKQGTYFGHDREEVTRLLIQGLNDLGYESAANRLSQESGYEVEGPTVAAFRNAIIQGQWSEAESLLFGVDSEADGGGVSISNGDWQHLGGLELADGADPDAMRFSIREQKYLELLENQDTGRAMMVLRHELQPLHHDRSRLDALSRSACFLYMLVNQGRADTGEISHLVCTSVENLREDARWDGALGHSRHILLQQLSSMKTVSFARSVLNSRQGQYPHR